MQYDIMRTEVGQLIRMQNLLADKMWVVLVKQIQFVSKHAIVADFKFLLTFDTITRVYRYLAAHKFKQVFVV